MRITENAKLVNKYTRKVDILLISIVSQCVTYLTLYAVKNTPPSSCCVYWTHIAIVKLSADAVSNGTT